MEGENIHVGAMVRKTEELELELGLSIGGSYRIQNDDILKSKVTTDICCSSKKNQSWFVEDATQELNPKNKREIHALRRQEAKKRREQKQLKNGYRKGNLNGNNNGMLKGKDFEVSSDHERECKKIKIEKATGIYHKTDDTRQVNLNLSIEQSDVVAVPSVIPVKYPHPLQYGLPANGFVYPCGNVNVMPCWFTGGAATAITGERNAVPLVSYGLVQFQADGCNSEKNGSIDTGENRKPGSNGSSLCSSSTGTDRRSSSHEGGGCGDSRSHSSPSTQQPLQLGSSQANDTKAQSEHSSTSHITDTGPVNEETHHVEKIIPLKSAQSSPTGPKQEAAKSETESSKGDIGEPAKPQPEKNRITSSLPYMPCVSTIGNGPNGKTIKGFLYRYTKTEVSIVCVCHGSSFSPSEFVQHAGGTGVSHPLKHITVVPSAF